MELHGKNIKKAVEEFGIKCLGCYMQMESWDIVHVTVVMENPEDAVQKDNLSHHLANKFGVGVILVMKTSACMGVPKFENENEENRDYLTKQWEKKLEHDEFFYRSKLDPKTMIEVAKILQRLQDKSCLGQYCDIFDKEVICKFYDNGRCTKEEVNENV